MNLRFLSILLVLFVTPILIGWGLAASGNAQSADQLRNQIKSTEEQIREINEDIVKYQAQVSELNQKSSSLSNTISSLKASERKLGSEISLTREQLNLTKLEIGELDQKITTAEEEVERHKEILAAIVRRAERLADKNMVEDMLAAKTITDSANVLRAYEEFKNITRDRVTALVSIKKRTEEEKDIREGKYTELDLLEDELEDKKSVLAYSKQEKEAVLSETKASEREYQTLLAQKQEQRATFLSQLYAYEQSLQKAIDQTKLPTSGGKALIYPLSPVQITQYFGRTSDSGRLYASGTHNGVDFGTPVGTNIVSAAGGSVWATGDTDQYPGCYSYGKWVLVKHTNGLSTMYAHLSQISVSPGQAVTQGQTIGYSGNTGYSTGPHLHFTVYATEGVTVQKFSQSTGCKQATIPLAAPNVYLDPLKYL